MVNVRLCQQGLIIREASIVDVRYGLMQSLAANVHNVNVLLLHGEEQLVWGGAGIDKRDEFKGRDVDWYIVLHPGERARPASPLQEPLERIKASIRAKVEHPFRVIKQQFGYGKVRYRSLAKNTNCLYLLSAFTNMLRAQNYLPS